MQTERKKLKINDLPETELPPRVQPRLDFPQASPFLAHPPPPTTLINFMPTASAVSPTNPFLKSGTTPSNPFLSPASPAIPSTTPNLAPIQIGRASRQPVVSPFTIPESATKFAKPSAQTESPQDTPALYQTVVKSQAQVPALTVSKPEINPLLDSKRSQPSSPSFGSTAPADKSKQLLKQSNSAAQSSSLPKQNQLRVDKTEIKVDIKADFKTKVKTSQLIDTKENQQQLPKLARLISFGSDHHLIDQPKKVEVKLNQTKTSINQQKTTSIIKQIKTESNQVLKQKEILKKQQSKSQIIEPKAQKNQQKKVSLQKQQLASQPTKKILRSLEQKRLKLQTILQTKVPKYQGHNYLKMCEGPIYQIKDLSAYSLSQQDLNLCKQCQARIKAAEYLVGELTNLRSNRDSVPFRLQQQFITNKTRSLTSKCAQVQLSLTKPSKSRFNFSSFFEQSLPRKKSKLKIGRGKVEVSQSACYIL